MINNCIFIQISGDSDNGFYSISQISTIPNPDLYVCCLVTHSPNDLLTYPTKYRFDPMGKAFIEVEGWEIPEPPTIEGF